MAPRIKVKTSTREELVDITAEVQTAIEQLRITDGAVHLWCLHTTCALTVNEGADPDVAADVVRFLRRLVPQDASFAHAEGNSDSHVKTSLFGPGLTLPVESGRLLLGVWQRVFLAEWDGPRVRQVAVTGLG